MDNDWQKIKKRNKDAKLFVLRGGEQSPKSDSRAELLWYVSLGIDKAFPTQQFVYGNLDNFSVMHVYRRDTWVEGGPPIIVLTFREDDMWCVQYSWQSPENALWLYSCEDERIIEEITRECVLKLGVHLGEICGM